VYFVVSTSDMLGLHMLHSAKVMDATRNRWESWHKRVWN